MFDSISGGPSSNSLNVIFLYADARLFTFLTTLLNDNEVLKLRKYTESINV